MFCWQIRKDLIGYIKDILSVSAKAKIKAHLDRCPECRQKAEEIKETLAFYHKAEDIEPSVDFDSVLAQKLEQGNAGVETVSLRDRLMGDYFRPNWVFGALAATVVIIAVLILSPLIRKRTGTIEIVEEDIESLRRQEPFLPASNIELNVLPKRENVQLTIYNSADLTLVREQRNLTLKKGWNWLQFMWANTLIDPTSLRLEPLAYRDKVDVQALVFPPRIKELGRWLIFSEISGEVPVEITYLTSGLSWRAFYMGTLNSGEKTMRLQGYVRAVNSSGEDYEDAQTRLIVGKVHILDGIAALAKRQYAYGRPDKVTGEKDRIPVPGDTPLLGMLFRDASGTEEGYRLKEIRKEGLSEYFLYTIEGTETIPNGWAKRLPSLESEEIPVTSLYKYDEERWGSYPVRFVAFANDKKHKLGDTPLPDGRISIYRSVDKENHLSYVGAAAVKYIPVDEEVELNLGPARQVTLEPKLMDFRTNNYLYDNKGNVSGWDEIRTWKLELKNTRTIPIRIEITRSFETPYWSLETDRSSGYEKHDMTHARFTVEVAARAGKDIGYTVTTYHGRRESAHR